MIRRYIWFDDKIKTRSGKRVPFWNFTILEQEVKDKELMWFHEAYEMMGLYRVHKVDTENFVAEDLGKWISTSNPDWEKYCDNPELALRAG